MLESQIDQHERREVQRNDRRVREQQGSTFLRSYDQRHRGQICSNRRGLRCRQQGRCRGRISSRRPTPS
jgi:hypothetical protein